MLESIVDPDCYIHLLPEIVEHRRQFATHTHVVLHRFLAPPVLAILRAQALLLCEHSIRRDFNMKSMGNTPRHMSTLGSQTLDKMMPSLFGIYRDSRLLQILSQIVGETVQPLPTTEIDQYVFNYLHQPADTHGGHFDDYPLSLVLLLDVPQESDGGYVEIVPFASSVHDLDTTMSQRIVLEAGDVYLLRSDTTAHRVAPLLRDKVKRVAFNFAYTLASFQPVYVSDSAAQLYL